MKVPRSPWWKVRDTCRMVEGAVVEEVGKVAEVAEGRRSSLEEVVEVERLAAIRRTAAGRTTAFSRLPEHVLSLLLLPVAAQ